MRHKVEHISLNNIKYRFGENDKVWKDGFRLYESSSKKAIFLNLDFKPITIIHEDDYEVRDDVCYKGSFEHYLDSSVKESNVF